MFRLSFVGVGPTELRIALAIGAFAAARSPSVNVAGTGWRLFDLGGIAGSAGLTVAFIASAIRNTRALYAEEPIGAAAGRAQA